MDEEMIERCARAIAEKDGYDSWDTAHKRTIEKYTGMVKVCIKAMREPTEKMLDEGAWIGTAGEIVGNQSAKEVWQTMIDVILNGVK